MTVVIENFRIDRIPVLEITQKGAPEHLPLVILIHGWTGRKEDVLFLLISWLYAAMLLFPWMLLVMASEPERRLDC